jgi:hypothetical protein
VIAVRQLSYQEILIAESPKTVKRARLTVESDIGRGGDVLIGLGNCCSHFVYDSEIEKRIECRVKRLFQNVSRDRVWYV